MARLPACCIPVLAVSLLAACTPDGKSLAVQGAATPVALESQLTKAAMARRNGQPQEAVTMMQAAAERDPENPAVLSQLGYALIETGRAQEAIGVFDRLIAINPGSAAAFNGKGVAFDHTGNHLAAQELYQHALALSPGAPSIRNNIAMSLILNGQVDQAIPILEDLNASKAGNATIRQNLALAYGIKGDKAKALALNLRDLPPDEAKENMRFYLRYAARTHKHKMIGIASGGHIGFAETPPEIAAAEPPKKHPRTHEEMVEIPKAQNETAGFDTLDYSFPSQENRR